MSHSCLICVAEDNPADVFLLRMALEEHGVECDLELFENGAETIAFIVSAELGERRIPDLFILDLNLPRVDGRSILRHLRTTEKMSHLPVLVWTSSDDPHDKAESERWGANRHIRKPSDIDDFMAIGGEIKAILKVAV